MTKEECIEACLAAEGICRQGAEDFSHDPNAMDATRACDECASACHRCHTALERGSSEYVHECAKLCQACAEACAVIDNPLAMECVEACQKAEAACNEIYSTPGAMKS
jgi:hypothetical protein